MGPLQCKLTISRSRIVKYEVIPAGPNPVDIEGDLCDDKLTKDTIKRLNRFIGGNTEFCEKDDLELLGRHLYHILFDGLTTLDGAKTTKTLGERFIETYGQFETDFNATRRQTGSDPDFRFRVTLIFEEGMDELAGYPWEFLYVPRPSNTGFFLAGEKAELILTRFVPKLGTPQSKTPDEQLIILIAWSQPKELGPVDESDTVIAIEKLAEDIEKELKQKNIEVIPFPQATHKKLELMIETKKPHIVHFIGHGQVREGKAKIALTKTEDQLTLEKAKIVAEGRRGEPDEADWVDSDSIRALFIKEPPRLVFLHACNSAKAPDSLKVFKSVAEQVLRANVPFVVAMQYEISNEDATSFAQTFYEKLGEGMSIDEAVKDGRNELGKKSPAWGHPRFGTPVVYLQSDDSVIVKKEVKEGKEGKDKPAVLGKQDCPYLNCRNFVSPDSKRCDCEQKKPFKQCPKCGMANTIDAIDCWYKECDYVFDTKQSQVSAPSVPVAATVAPGGSAAAPVKPQREQVPDPGRGPQT